jgi:hypothetical protein
MLLPAAVELDHPALWIGEPDSVEQFDPQPKLRCASLTR